MSRTIPLTQGKLAIVDDEDYERLSRHKWCAYEHGDTWYAARNSSTQNGKSTLIRMHREILKPPANRETDHKDHNGLNNQRENLRIATTAQNQQNRLKKKGTSSRFKGVYWDREHTKWRARIQIAGKRLRLGYFDSEIEAAKAYDVAAIKYFGEFARTNFLTSESFWQGGRASEPYEQRMVPPSERSRPTVTTGRAAKNCAGQYGT